MSAGIYGADNRAFHYAVLCSIILHGLLLLALPGLRESSRREDAHLGPLVARLAPTPRVAPAPPKAEPQPRAEEPPAQPVAKPSPAPKPAPIARPQKAPAKSAPPPVSPPAPQAAQPPPQAAPAPAPPAAIAKAEPSPAATAPAAPPEAADAGTLAQYRLELISVAKRYKRYPRVAMDNNWEGTAEIRMVVGANGMIASLVVRKGTGHDILDQEALQWIRKAKPLAPIPASLRGKEFVVDIPVIFNLKEPS
ncbi:MAG TPA: energy transducer TonB [Burkholderiales bacterium]|nr:energy transducer TonB [Burkholderiales bacterium]